MRKWALMTPAQTDAVRLLIAAADTWTAQHPTENKFEFVAAIGEYLAGVFAAIDGEDAWPTFQRITTGQIARRRATP